MNIGQASKASGVPSKMIRYYESTGIIATPPRTSGGYRVYSDSDVNTLRFLHRARDLGFSIDQIQDLLTLWRDRSRASHEVKALALAQVHVLEEKAHSLLSLSRALRHLADHCRGDYRPECPILDDLSKPPSDGRTRQTRTADEARSRW
jgi:MerR family transcriptional regulator, copper efflux regulator